MISVCACGNVTCNRHPITASLKLWPSSEQRHSEAHTAVKLNCVCKCAWCQWFSWICTAEQCWPPSVYATTKPRGLFPRNCQEKIHPFIIIDQLVKDCPISPEAPRIAILNLKREKKPLQGHSRFRTAGSHRGLEENPSRWRNLGQILLWDWWLIRSDQFGWNGNNVIFP